ncbi:bis(5'-nucleosyl)-tetraphosphatase (symmetrical) YqeK [Desulfitobacterium sp. THU1]|uniref:bis(5'-nucleosyl)-tetraphosphatase (symmetrical) YqeK n=1 Tax=Desulfitobacterium sp. THU1 TaxID=3138072 RepID=UPI00311DAD0F
MDIQQANELAQRSMSTKRFSHTLRVVQWAKELAAKHHVDEDKAQIAAYLHDIKKEISLQEQIELAREWHLSQYTAAEDNPHVLHGPLAAYWLEHELGYKDTEVLAAIANHTLGAPGMGKLEMLIYSADLTEPYRTFPNVDKLRQSLYDNLENGTLLCVEHTLNYLLKSKRAIHPQTRLTYEDLKRRQKFADR